MDAGDFDDPKAPCAVPSGPATADGKLPAIETDATTASLVTLVSQAAGLLDEATALTNHPDSLVGELGQFINWCSVPLKLMVRHVLENPEDLVPKDACPNLYALLDRLQSNEYKRKRQRHLELSEKVEDEQKLVQLRRKLRLQVVAVLSQLAMMRDQRANPPWIVMRSIDRLYQGTSQSDWEMLTRERLLVDRTGLRRAMTHVKDWRPTPFGDMDEISPEYTLVAHDNKEWRLCYKWERWINGKKIENPIYHTVTSVVDCVE